MFTHLFIENLRDAPASKMVFYEENQAFSAGELWTEAQHLALFLEQQGLRRGDKVLLAIPPGVELLRLMYALMLLRAVVAIVDPEMGQDNYRNKVRQLEPRFAFLDSRLLFLQEHPLLFGVLRYFQKSLPNPPALKGCQLFSVGRWMPICQTHTKMPRFGAFLSRPTPDFVLQEASEKDDFLIVYTSGTLNEPKGVTHSFGSLNRSLDLLRNLLLKGKNDRIATHLPHFMLLGINAGLEVFLWDNTMSPEKKLNFIQTHQITTLFGPPSDFLPIIEFLEKNKVQFPACLNHIYLGSAPIYVAFLEKMLPYCTHTDVTSLYGMTECLMVSYQDAREKVRTKGTGDLVGTPFDGVQIHRGEGGELRVVSDQMFSRYFGSKADVVAVHPTGDLGEVDCLGRIWLTGRKKDMIIRRNFNIYPGLYEPTIHRIPGVRAAAMVGIFREHLADEEVVLVIESDKKMETKQLLQKLRHGSFAIDKEALPDTIVFRELPRSGRQQKIDRKALRLLLSSERPIFADTPKENHSVFYL